MYIWKIDSLIRDLQNDSLEQKERANYLIAWVTVTAFVLETSYLFEPLSATYLQLGSSAAVVLITAAGTYYCYQVNRRADDWEFLARFISIGWVVGIRLGVFFLIVYTIYAIAGYVILGDDFDEYLTPSSSVEILITPVLSVLFYVFVAGYIKKTAAGSGKNSESEPTL